MKQEDRELLLKDLSARLPYGVICNDSRHGDSRITEMNIVDETVYCVDFDEYVELDKCKLYLRSMSNMTEEEEKEYRKTMDKYTHRLYPNSADFSEHTEYSWTTETFDFLNAHHLDYRGLIPMGLANEAPKGMYNFN